MRIAVCTSLSDLMLECVLDSNLVVDTDPAINSRLKECGVESIHLPPPSGGDWETRDRNFKRLAMPGSLDRPFLGTDLPIWKVLSLDRLSFWYRDATLYDEVMALNWTEAFVPLDLYHPLPFTLARHSGRKVIGVQTSTLRTREWKDLLETGNFPVSECIVEGEWEEKLLGKYGIKVKNANLHKPHPKAEGRDEMRKALGIPISARVCLIVFESQCEWEFRKAVPWLAQNYYEILTVPLSQRDRENLQLIQYRGKVVDWSVEDAVDDVIAFRYNPVLESRKVNVKLVDPASRWMLNELA